MFLFCLFLLPFFFFFVPKINLTDINNCFHLKINLHLVSRVSWAFVNYVCVCFFLFIFLYFLKMLHCYLFVHFLKKGFTKLNLNLVFILKIKFFSHFADTTRFDGRFSSVGQTLAGALNFNLRIRRRTWSYIWYAVYWVLESTIWVLYLTWFCVWVFWCLHFGCLVILLGSCLKIKEIYCCCGCCYYWSYFGVVVVLFVPFIFWVDSWSYEWLISI